MFKKNSLNIKFTWIYIIIVFLMIALGGSAVYPDTGKTRYHVIIDTDAAADDLRALCLFLASPEFEILAITTSDGVLDPKQGLIKIKSLLTSFGHAGIPWGAGQERLEKAPPWRDFNQNILWGPEKIIEIGNEPSAVDTILTAVEYEEEPVLLVCLGGLTNIAEALRQNPQIQKKIEKIVWYCDNFSPISGTNYKLDEKSAQAVLSSQIEIIVVSNKGTDSQEFTMPFLQSLQEQSSLYAQKIVSSHNQHDVFQRIRSGHLEFWDDLLPLYLLYPDLFTCKTSPETEKHKMIHVRDWEKIKSCYLEVLSARNEVESEVFKGFPEDPKLYADDVHPYMQDIIQRYGKEEWRLGVITNELHGHLGIYAVIGTKMGLRARQHFHIGLDDISILSYAGSTPPLSCMNDGLQVSTGGTLGHGLIKVTPNPPFQPQAVFTFKHRAVRLRLKDQYWNIIKKDIKQGIELHGLNTKGYWDYVRKLALKYWLEWDRREIFSSEILSAGQV